MGVYYFYVNDTRKQYSCIDPSLSEIKRYALGRNIGSRAFSYLILDNDPNWSGVEAHPMVGSWIGDRLFVTGDDYSQRFSEIRAEYTDIGQAIIEMLVDISPYDLLGTTPIGGGESPTGIKRKRGSRGKSRSSREASLWRKSNRPRSTS